MNTTRDERGVVLILMLLLLAAVLVAVGIGAFVTIRHRSQTSTQHQGFVADQGKTVGDRVYVVEPCDKLGNAKLDAAELAKARAAYILVGFTPEYFDAHFKYRETANGWDIFQICAGQGAAVTAWGNNHPPSIGWAMSSYPHARAHDYVNLIPIAQAVMDLDNCAAAAGVSPKGATAYAQLDSGKGDGDRNLEPYLYGEGYINHGAHLSTVYDFWINLETGKCSTTTSGAAS